MSKVGTCDRCRFWERYPADQDPQESDGECHRYAPKPADYFMLPLWPGTDSTDWCGEFETQ